MSQKKVQLHGGQLLLGAFTTFIEVVKAACGEDEDGRNAAHFARALESTANEHRGGPGCQLNVHQLLGSFVDALRVTNRDGKRPKTLPSLKIVDGRISLRFELNPPRPKAKKKKLDEASAPIVAPEIEEPQMIAIELAFFFTEGSALSIYLSGTETLVDGVKAASALAHLRYSWQSA